MGSSNARMVLPHSISRLARGSALACALAIPFISVAIIPSQVQAQDALGANYQSDPNARMLLQADELVYDRDVNVVTAQGKVRIEYDGNRLVADNVTYNQQTRRMTATGNVEIVERDGNKIYSDHLDVTDSFRDGFVNGLRVETTDNTRFAAESAERSNGEITTFNNGVYTACQACEKILISRFSGRSRLARSSGTARPKPCVSNVASLSCSVFRWLTSRLSKWLIRQLSAKAAFCFPVSPTRTILVSV